MRSARALHHVIKAYHCIGTRYEKLHATFSAMVSAVCILISLKY